MRPNGNHDSDVIVLGGGPAGAATAIALRQRGLSVVVVERSDYGERRVGETLPPTVRPLLERLGVWQRFRLNHHALAYGIHSVWGHAEVYHNEFIFHPYGAGWHVDRRRFDVLLVRCADEAGARVYRAATVLHCGEENPDHWRINFSCDETRYSIRAKFLVDATGRAALVARHKGATRIVQDRLVGVVAFLSPAFTNAQADSFTLVEAAENGWWYSAALPDSRLMLAFMTDGDLYAKVPDRSSAFWLQQLRAARHTRARARAYALTSIPRVVPASSFRLDKPSGKNWLAVGDAAMAFDPLSSQGICKALKTGLSAAHAIDECLSGSDATLLDYDDAAGQTFENYMRTHREYYANEKRWSDSVFWQRRHSESF